ncbi:PIN domain-containing protein [Treponema parvum]|uniref:PIN domain-containing protein n=1 Tax=Treponema parvum TaxID=138851 RepID=A0A975IFI3_9SPIR|nr:PIN domain-containing protein [Treponema parvum]QTQ15016.1 PIN domain-containing protein [Treponema parvum]
MNFILVDTSVWSLILRKRELCQKEKKLESYLINLIRKRRVIMIGPIRQEILSGISDLNTYTTLRQKLETFSDFEITTRDYETAAEYFNLCRKHGIQGSHIDYLICSVAANNNFSILSLDKDFCNYKKYIDIDIIDENEWNMQTAETR